MEFKVGDIIRYKTILGGILIGEIQDVLSLIETNKDITGLVYFVNDIDCHKFDIVYDNMILGKFISR